MRSHPKRSPEHRVSPSRSRASKPSPGRDLLLGRGGPDPEDGPTPICRCRVLYLGSSVPHITKDGLQGIQEPLKELYPEEGTIAAKGIDSWLSVWSNGFLLENVGENRKTVSRFFPIDSLHYCAAVRYVQVPGTSGEKVQRFLPLDSPFARNPNLNHPPLFAAILRRTTGIKVLECHVFICKRETAANALVRCSFHAYADSTYAKHLENGTSLYGTVGAPTPVPPLVTSADLGREYQQSMLEVSDDSLTSIDRLDEYGRITNGPTVTNPLNLYQSPVAGGSGGSGGSGQGVSSHPGGSGGQGRHNLPNGSSSPTGNGGGVDDISVFNGDDNHKVWAGRAGAMAGPGPGEAGSATVDTNDGIYGDYGSTMRSFRSNVSGISSRQRPRQMMMQSPPPPPIPEEFVNVKEDKEKKEKKKRRKSKSREAPSADEIAHMMNGGVSNGNGTSTAGSVVNVPSGRASSMMGGRKMSAGSFMGLSPNGRPPMNGMPPPGPPPPGQYGPPPPQMILPGPKSKKSSGTFSSGRKGAVPRGLPPYMMYGPGLPPPGYMVPPGPPPHLMPPLGHRLYGPPPPFGGPFPMGGGRAESHMEEPIYMPQDARPLSPVASYQPGHFPHHMYYSQQQYATVDRARKHRKHKKHSRHIHSSDSNAEDSEYGGNGAGAGIYKKEHLNERAFANSMRNEQRSRSYGSLADMEPETASGNGGGGAYDERQKKDMLHHMMEDLSMDDERIERSEVPPDFFPPPPQDRRGGGPVSPGHHAMYPPVHTNGPIPGAGRRRR